MARRDGMSALISAAVLRLSARIADMADPLNGAGMAGMSGTLAYAPGTVGAFLAGLGRVVAETVAGVTPANYAFPPLDIRRYGAIGDDATNCNAAYTAAARTACCWFSDNLTAAAVYVPAGKFLITLNNFIGQFDFTTLPGVFNARYRFGIRGDGWASQIHWKPTGAGEAWMYDNGSAASANNRLVQPLFSRLRFTLDVTGLSAGGTVNGFRIFGSPGNATQGFKFDRCHFVGVDYPGSAIDIAKAGTLVALLGTVNASETSIRGCNVRGMKTLLDIGPNAEAVNHNLVNTDAEVMYGDVIKIAGGSNVTWHGGSVTMMSEAVSYLVAMRSTTAAFVGTHLFSGLRCEFNINTALTLTASRLFLLNTASVADPPSFRAKVTFHGCNFYPFTGGARDSIVVDAASQMVINFDGCDIFADHKIAASSSIAGLQAAFNGPYTTINFCRGSAVPFANVAYADANSAVRVSARDCNNTLDYDLTASGRSEARNGRNIPLKTATIRGSSWPDVGVPAAMRIVLPQGCLIKAVRFRKLAGGASATAYQLRATDDNAAVNYASSVAGAQNIVHEAQADNINVVADSAAKQAVNIITTGTNNGAAISTPMLAGDYVMVDYY